MKQLNCVALIKLKLIAYVDNSKTSTDAIRPLHTFKSN